MNNKLVFITRKIHDSVIKKISRYADIDVWPDSDPPSEQILIDKINDCVGLYTLLTDPITKEVIDSAGPDLKVISQMAVGVDNIDLSAAIKKRIPVGHTPGILTETTADFTWSLILSMARRVVEANNEVRAGIWRPWGPDVLCGLDVHNSTLGIIGLGRIGKAVARRASGFSMKILYYEPEPKPDAEEELGVKYASLNELLTQSDFITLHVYLSDTTRHMISRDQLNLMKSTAILVNTSRGGIIDIDELYLALKNNKIRAAALDVFEPEPVPQDHPILKMNNLILTPHIASASEKTRYKMQDVAADNLIAGLKGEQLPYCANPEVYKE
jgi:glyoxylate reductase